MASSPETDGPRHLGRVIDPLARDDGATEPALELEPEAGSAPVEKAEAAPEAAPVEKADAAPAPVEKAEAAPAAAPVDQTEVAPVGEAASEADAALGVAPVGEADAPDPAPRVVSEDAGLAGNGAAPAAEEQSDKPPEPVREGGHPVRDKLLARAAQSRRERADKLGGRMAHGGLDEIGRDHPPATRPLDVELDLVGAGAGRPPAAPLVQQGGAQLSPGMVALFGTLLGLATVASLIALMIHLRPAVHPQARRVVARAAPSTTAATRAAPAPKAQRQKMPGPWRIDDLKGDSSYRIIGGEIGRQPFLTVIQEKGLDKSQAYSVLHALKDLVNLDKCGPHDRFEAAVKRSTKQLTAFEYIASKDEIYQARADKSGALQGKKLDMHVQRAEVKGAFAYNGQSLDSSAQAAGFGPGLKDTLDDALGGRVDLDGLSRGDVFRVIAQEVTVLGGFDRYAGIEAVEYRPTKDKPERFYYFRDSQGNAGYYDQDGKAPYKGGWRFPIPGAHVTSPFNLHRMNPVLHKMMPHLGTDFGAPIGTPVHASNSGVVERMSSNGTRGNLVMLKHSGGYETGYAHLARFANGLKEGDQVERFQVIGYVGSTGRSTGPHLHWLAKKDGKFIDPMTLEPDKLRVLPGNERAAFAQIKAKYDAMLDAIPLPEVQSPPPAAATPPAQPAAQQAPTQPAAPTGNAVAAAPAPAGNPGAPAQAQSAAPPGGHTSAVYLTDKQLLKLQSATDDGEVPP